MVSVQVLRGSDLFGELSDEKVAGIISSRLRNTRSQLCSARTEGLITHG